MVADTRLVNERWGQHFDELLRAEVQERLPDFKDLRTFLAKYAP